MYFIKCIIIFLKNNGKYFLYKIILYINKNVVWMDN